MVFVVECGNEDLENNVVFAVRIWTDQIWTNLEGTMRT